MRNLFTCFSNFWSKILGAPHSASIGTRWKPAGNLHSFAMCAAMFVMLFVAGVGEMWGTTSSVSISTYATSNSWSNDTRYYSVTIDGNVTATASNGGDYNGTYNSANTQWRFYQNGSGTLTITTTSGTLSSVTLTFNTKDNGTLSYGWSGVTSGSAVSVSGTSATFTVGASSGTKGKIFITAISVTYGSSCSNSVTINKGSATNCSFELGKTGAQASCDGVSTTVSITPNTGYGNPSVTQSGASAAPTITGTGTNSQTVSYAANTTGISTINVSCSANTYTITLNKDLTPTTSGTASITATYNSNNNLTSAIDTPTKTGWTFAGYYTAKNGGGTQIIDADGNVLASKAGYTDASKNWIGTSDVTLYAKWTCTVTWSVNGLTNVYSAHTLTYNGTSTKVASIPGPPSPATYCGDKFMGWTTESDVSQDDDTGLNLFTNVAGSPELKTVGNTTFYAVFADYDDED